MGKRRKPGMSTPLLIIIAIILLALVTVGFIAGPIGQGILGKIGLTITVPSWLNVPKPAVHLPASTVFHIFGLPITNSIVASWVTIVFLVVVCWAATRRMKMVPGRLQAAFEFIVGWVYDLCRSVAGEENGRRFFPLVATIFLFVMFNSWLSLIPGFGSIEVGHHVHLFRGANTDVNTPLALALVSFVMVLFFGLKAMGLKYLEQYFNVRQFFKGLSQLFRGRLKAGFNGVLMGAIDIFVGVLELLSHLIRILSFTFRLFGNMTAGEILLLIAAFLLPWVFAIPFYGLELLVGFVQALIFGGLTLVFLTVAVTSHHAE
ncbi:F0F1 ATP synthase subunit A [Chloroflexota bacterium]